MSELIQDEGLCIAEVGRLDAEAMALLVEFLPISSHLDRAIATAQQRLDYTKAQYDKAVNVLYQLHGQQDSATSPEDEDLLKSLGLDEDSFARTGGRCLDKRLQSASNADPNRAAKDEVYMAQARRDMKKNLGVGSKKGSGRMFDKDHLDEAPEARGQVVSGVGVEDEDEDSEVSGSRIDAGLLDENGEPRTRARSCSTGSHISVVRRCTTPPGRSDEQEASFVNSAAEPEMNKTPPAHSQTEHKPASPNEKVAEKKSAPNSMTAKAPELRGLNLGSGLQPKAHPSQSSRNSTSREKRPRSRPTPAQRTFLDEVMFGSDPSSESPLHPAGEPSAASQEELQPEEMADVSRASSESSDGLFVSEKTPWVYQPREPKTNSKRGRSKKRKPSLGPAARSSSGKGITSQKRKRVNAEANVDRQQQTSTHSPTVASSDRCSQPPVVCAPAKVSLPASNSTSTSITYPPPASPADASATFDTTEQLPLGNAAWSFNILDETEAPTRSSDEHSPKNNHKEHRNQPPAIRSKPSHNAQVLKTKLLQPQKARKSVHFDQEDVLLYPTRNGKSFQLIGQQAKGPLIPTPEETQRDWTHFEKIHSDLKASDRDEVEEEKLEGSLEAFNRKKGKKATPKSKLSSKVDESEDEYNEEPRTLRGSSPKSISKKKGKKVTAKGIDAFKSNHKVNKPEPKNKKKAGVSQQQLQDVIRNSILGASKKAGKRNTSGFFGPDQ